MNKKNLSFTDKVQSFRQSTALGQLMHPCNSCFPEVDPAMALRNSVHTWSLLPNLERDLQHAC